MGDENAPDGCESRRLDQRTSAKERQLLKEERNGQKGT